MATHRGMPKVKRVKPLDPFLPGRHRRSRRPAVAAVEAPAPVPRAQSSHRPGSGRTDRPSQPARAEMERRATVRAPRATQSQLDRHHYARSVAKGNYPPRSDNRRRDTRELTVRDDLGLATDTRTGRIGPKEGTREQLAKRRAAMGQPTEAELRSRAAGIAQANPDRRRQAPARQVDKPTKKHTARGVAQRPASRLPVGDPAHGTPLEASRRHPQLSGSTFAGRFFS